MINADRAPNVLSAAKNTAAITAKSAAFAISVISCERGDTRLPCYSGQGARAGQR